MFLQKNRWIWGFFLLCGSASEIFSSSSEQPTSPPIEQSSPLVTLPFKLIITIAEHIVNSSHNPRKDLISLILTCKKLYANADNIISNLTLLREHGAYLWNMEHRHNQEPCREYNHTKNQFSSCSEHHKEYKAALSLGSIRWFKENILNDSAHTIPFENLRRPFDTLHQDNVVNARRIRRPNTMGNQRFKNVDHYMMNFANWQVSITDQDTTYMTLYRKRCQLFEDLCTHNATHLIQCYEEDEQRKNNLALWVKKCSEKNIIITQYWLALLLHDDDPHQQCINNKNRVIHSLQEWQAGLKDVYSRQDSTDRSRYENPACFLNTLYHNADKALVWLLEKNPLWIPNASLWVKKNGYSTIDPLHMLNLVTDYEFKNYLNASCSLVKNLLHVAAQTNNLPLAALAYTQEEVGEEFAHQYDSHGDLPIHVAVRQQNTPMIDFLFQKNQAALDLVNLQNKNSYGIAQEIHAPENFIQYLQRKNKFQNTTDSTSTIS